MEKRKAPIATGKPLTWNQFSDHHDVAIKDALKVLGIEKLSDPQKIILNAVHHGTDCLSVLPTGSGKSLCYIVPFLTRRKSVVVISPLISLMHDQIEQLAQVGVRAIAFDYLQSLEEQQTLTKEILTGKPMLIYVSPERFLSDRFLEILNSSDLALFAVDEAHCVVKWGFQFRQKYRKLGTVLSRFSHVPKLALTATATTATRADIERLLELRNPVLVTASPLRPNLHITSSKAPTVVAQHQKILDLINTTPGQGIVYVPTKKIALQIYDFLRHNALAAGYYHGDCSATQRRQVYRDFFEGRLKVIVATSAFGMGVNKSDIRFVIHAGPPRDLESYLQEIGRAGRDGQSSECSVIYTTRDCVLNKYMVEATLPPLDLTLEVFNAATKLIQSFPEIHEKELVSRISQQLDKDGRSIRNALELMIRENVICRWTDVRDTSHQIFEIGSVESREDVFWDEYPTRRSLAFKNLSDMHQAVAQDSLKESIEKYFC